MDISEYKKYAVGLEASQSVLSWIDTALNNYLQKNKRFVEAKI